MEPAEQLWGNSPERRQLVELAAFGLGLMARTEVDGREILLVGSVVRRAVELVGANWEEFSHWFVDDDALSSVLDRFPSQVAALSYREHGSGQEFRFEKVPLTRLSEDELLRRLSSG